MDLIVHMKEIIPGYMLIALEDSSASPSTSASDPSTLA